MEEGPEDDFAILLQTLGVEGCRPHPCGARYDAFVTPVVLDFVQHRLLHVPEQKFEQFFRPDNAMHGLRGGTSDSAYRELLLRLFGPAVVALHFPLLDGVDLPQIPRRTALDEGDPRRQAQAVHVPPCADIIEAI